MIHLIALSYERLRFNIENNQILNILSMEQIQIKIALHLPLFNFSQK